MSMEAAVWNPPATQQNSYPGLHGLEELAMGTRGLVTTARFRLIGADGWTLNRMEMVVRSYLDETPYILVDHLGNVWPWVKLEAAGPEGGPILRNPWSGQCSRVWTARFRHLRPDF